MDRESAWAAGAKAAADRQKGLNRLEEK